jgi:tetratricopeptide (TPR) repeat protein
VRDDISFVLVEVDPAYQKFLELRNRGFEHMYRNELDDAIVELESALEIDERDAKAHSLLGKCYFRYGDYRRAGDHLSMYLTYNPEDAEGWLQLANSLYNTKKYRESLHAAQQACQLRPNFKSAMVLWGLSLKKLGRPADARQVWERILGLDGSHRVALEELRALDEAERA